MDASSDSESEEFDQQELEVALYSQIHFDAGFSSEALRGKQNSPYHHVTLPFRVRVKELPKRTTQIARKQPVLGGDFLAFSEAGCDRDDIEAVNVKRNNNDSSVLNVKEEVTLKKIDFGIDRCPDQQESKKSVVEIISKDVVDRSESATFTNELTAPSCVSQKAVQIISSSKKYDNKEKHNKKAKRVDKKIKEDKKLDLGASAGENSKDHIPESSDFNYENVDDARNVNIEKDDIFNKRSEAPSKIECLALSKKPGDKDKADGKQRQKREVLLPFTVTKAARRFKKVETECSPADCNIKDQVSQDVEIKKSSKHGEKTLPKLEEFLELSEPDPLIKLKKKAPLRKADVAVKPRCPPVRLRRPPAVIVKYRQDSDTNTDYSDSEASTITSPVKAEESTASSTSKASASESCISLSLASDNISAANKRKGKEDTVKETTVKTEDESVWTEDEDESSASSSDDDDDSDSKNVSEDSNDVEDDGNDVSSSSDSEDEEERAGSGTEDTDSSSQIDFLSETNPDLEFNLEGGVHGLLRVEKSPDNDNWKIDEKDLYNLNSIRSRYFSPHKIQCRNCKGEGHMSRDCPLPMKRPCIFCGIEGHVYQACPNAICYNCDAPGHKTTDCAQPKRSWHTMCERCWMPGHGETVCPDRWRQYHITVESRGGRIQTGDKGDKNPLVYCYNCGKKGHLGYECRAPRMNKFTTANYPFIARYDTKRKRQEMTQARDDAERHSKRSRHQHESTKTDRVDGDRSARNEHHRHKRSKQSKREGRHSRYASGPDHPEIESNSRHTNSSHKSNRRDHSRSSKSDSRDRGSSKASRQTALSKEGTSESRKKKKMKRKADKYEERQSGSRREELSIPGTSKEEREFEEGEIEDDILDDFEGHQVNDNEWWNRGDRPPKKKRKRSGKRSSTYSESDDNWRRDMDTDFQDNPPPRQRHVDDHRNEGPWRKGQGRGHHSQGKHRQRHPPPPPQNFNELQTPSHYQSSENLQFSGNWNDGFAQNWGRRPGRGQRGGGLTHSASWPVLRNQGSQRGINRGGFRAQNDRFVAMKNSCDITINLRK